jgi:glycerol-3-phosphate dehydrogenase
VTEAYDIAIIGGGVNGAGIARDAAGRGAQVLLLEARDLASGTSSASTKLVHGGLRYLEYYEFGLVREALGEREVLWRIAPHIVRPMRFVLPHDSRQRPRWMLRAGLWLYDHIGGRRTLPGAKAIRLDRHVAGEALGADYTHGFEYSDGWVDDARLVVLNAVDARERGADIRTHCRMTSARREGGLWRIEAGGESFHARALVNAAGPGADDVDRLAGLVPARGLRRVRGSHIVVPKLFDHDYAYLLQQPDTRIVFAIPYEDDFTLIGTTDADHSGSLEDVHIGEDETDYLLAAANRSFRRALGRGDIAWTYAGVRALVDDGSGRPEAATRGYELPLSQPEDGAPVLSVYGGKITSYRHLAEAAVDALAARLPALEGARWTAKTALPGGEFDPSEQAEFIAGLNARYPFLSAADAVRIARAYGTRAEWWLEDAQDWNDLGRNFGAGLTEAEIAYLQEAEWARSAEDVLWRRSKLGLHLSEAEREAVSSFLKD